MNKAAETTLTPEEIRLADYKAPDYQIEKVDLDFTLDPERTRVKSKLVVKRVAEAQSSAALTLDGEDLDLVSLLIDGQPVPDEHKKLEEKTLTLTELPSKFLLEIETICAPANNKALSGLYLSNGMFCTQCEAEGFRRITYFPDRPDVLTKFSVRIEANKKSFPVLLSNGNKLNEGDLPDGNHFTEWADPHPKPSYLFALVAGDLVSVDDNFTTMSGRTVDLKVFVQPQNKDKCTYTLDALKRSMRWDEETFGREYDLDIFMIVAVDHFNFGAMENKGLNIFNSAYVLASPETATDADYETIESIVAHEYFHNWSGNRVTCRDWFQLCLKEGFTVFRDQEFSADMRSRPVQRIKDVQRLWASQFPEDNGPLAHPARPESYITIDNFYTATVYEKGAELCRMIKTLIGPENFRKGSDLYFDRHDGEAATVEDFVGAMQDASGKDLTQFWRWYSDAGTPALTISMDQNEDGIDFSFEQHTNPTPGQPEKPARQIPINFAIIGRETGSILKEGLIELTQMSEKVHFSDVKEPAVPSFLREYSAPVSLDIDLSIEDQITILKNETDLFNRWASADRLWRNLSLSFADAKKMDDQKGALAKFADAIGASLSAIKDDPAFAAELLHIPSEAELAQSVDVIEPDNIVAGRSTVKEYVAQALKPQLSELYNSLTSTAPYSPDAKSAGVRALRNAALNFLVCAGEYELAEAQAKSATNMTDEAAATAALALSDSPYRDSALSRFYEKWRHDPLVINKWLAWKAMTPAQNALAEVKSLMKHEAFDTGNPNKVRALIGAFAMRNLGGFHRADGSGYHFLKEQVLLLDKSNPQLAARLIQAVENWRKLEPTRKEFAKLAIKEITEAKPLSSNVYEMATRLLDN